MRIVIVVLLLAAMVWGCGGSSESPNSDHATTAARRTVVWLDDRGLDEMTAAELRLVGVDGVLVRQGVLDLTGRAPVLRIDSTPSVASGIPVGVVLRVEGAREGLDSEMAEAAWRAIEAQGADRSPSEIVLDLPAIPVGMAAFVEGLVALADIPLVPLLSVEQLQHEEAVRVAEVSGVCLVPVFGTSDAGFRGIGEGGARPLSKKLAPLVGRGVDVRVGIGLRPVIEPAILEWGDDLNPLTESENGQVRTSSTLDRTFVLQRELDWSGRTWAASDRIAVGWWDAARLHMSFSEIDRLALPDVIGWDLAPLPPSGQRLGISEEVLIRYLAGEGPAPELTVDARRSGRTVRVSLANSGPFVSAVSSAGNWLEVSVSQGSLVVDGRGSFDTIELGTRRGGTWKKKSGSVADGVRFGETFLAPHEELDSGRIRLSVSRARVTVRWHIQLSSGDEVTGELTR